MSIEFIVPLVPISKKNSQQIVPYKGRWIIVPSSQYKKYEKQACGLLKNTVAEPINYPVNVRCLFYMPTHRKCDLTNMEESIDDVMIKAGIIEDDNHTIVVGHDGSRVLYDKENPRTEILIEEM